MKLLAIALLALALTACAQVGPTPEQIRAAGKDATAICTEIFSPWGKGRTVYLNIDRKVIEQGSFNVNQDCGVVFQNSVPAPPVTNSGQQFVPQPGQP